MESEFAHILVPYLGWIMAFLLAIVNGLLWSRLNKVDKDLKSLRLEFIGFRTMSEGFEKRYYEKHAELKDLEIRMGQMETRIVAKIGDVQAHMAAVAAHLALKERKEDLHV
jgi:hypothetical protein